LKAPRFFFVFCVFLHENNTKQHDFNTFRKLREEATTIVLWENDQKRKVHGLAKFTAISIHAWDGIVRDADRLCVLGFGSGLFKIRKLELLIKR
jgi:hypothetical protein